MNKHTEVEEIVKKLSQSVHYSSGYGQYRKGSPEGEAYLNGVETAIAMMYIDLTGTPKTKGVLEVALTTAKREATRKLSPFMQHDCTCATEFDAGACDCGLAEVLK